METVLKSVEMSGPGVGSGQDAEGPTSPPVQEDGKDEAQPPGFDWLKLDEVLVQFFLPADRWSADEDVLAALDTLPEPHRQKKRATVLALVGAKLAGQAEEGVFGRPDTCSRNIWHSKWKKDTVIGEALATVLAAAEKWRATDEVRSLQAASRYLALGAPAAAARLVTMLAHSDAAQVRLAAQAILDRADFSTAAKSSSLHGEMEEMLDDETQAAVTEALRQTAARRT